MNNTLDIIKDSEKVARLIDNEWVVNGKLQLSAFALRPKETYISVRMSLLKIAALESCNLS